MAHSTKTVFSICRFCLIRDLNQLVPMADVVDPVLSLQDVEVFTGIENLIEDHKGLAICHGCTSKIKQAVVFRSFCLSNDTLFRGMLQTSVEITIEGSVKQESSFEDPEESPAVFEFVVVNSRKKRKPETGKTKPVPHEPGSPGNEEETSDFVYSANRIDLGESFSSDEQQDECAPWKERNVKLNSSALLFESIRRIRARMQPDERLEQADGISGNESDSSQFTPACDKMLKPSKYQHLCEICGKQVHQINVHMPSHTKEAKYSCPHCPVKMTNHGNLYRHVQAVHLKKVVKSCDVCNKGFTSKGSYKSHMRAQHGIGETYECKICPRKFNHAGNYRVHFIRCHTDERKFSCSTCGKQFKEKRDHRNHQRVHSNDKPFSCSHCPKGFKSEYARKTHELTHRGVVFQCTQCDKTYRYKCLLNTHLKKDHPTIKSESADG